MKNFKALMLGILILVPVFIFIFVFVFGEQHFTLRTYLPEVNENGEVVRDAKGDTVFAQIPPFELTSQTGRKVTQDDVDNGVYVVDFFYTDCTGDCAQTSSQLMRVQEAFEQNPLVKIVSFTLQPAKDSVEALQMYAKRYSANPKQWYFLTGPDDQIKKLVKGGFAIDIKQAGDGELLHSNKLMLIDRQHKVRGIYNGASVTDVDRLMMEINVMLDEYSKSK